MGRTAEELAAVLSVEEWHQWLAYYRQYGPWGLRRLDYYMAQVSQAVVNMGMGKGQPKKLGDFLIWDKPRPAVVTDGREALAIFKALAEASSGK